MVFLRAADGRQNRLIEFRVGIRFETAAAANFVVGPQAEPGIKFIIRSPLILVSRRTIGEIDDHVWAETSAEIAGQRLADEIELRLNRSLAKHHAGAEPDVGPEAEIFAKSGNRAGHAEERE